MKMQSINNGNLLEIIDLAHSLRQEHLFIANEQAAFNRLNETLSRNSSSVAQVCTSVLEFYYFVCCVFVFKNETKMRRQMIKNKKNANFREPFYLFHLKLKIHFNCILLSIKQLAWICSQQRQNLNSLIISRPDTGPTECCHKANTLENTRFVEAHKAKNVKYEVSTTMLCNEL